VVQHPKSEAFLEWPEILRQYMLDTTTARLCTLADGLGVSRESLQLFGFVWAERHQAWAIPMHDGTSKVVGIRLRSEAGDKWAVRGSQQGLFLPRQWRQQPIVICEGPTDSAAIADAGFDVIGRPSCRGCIREALSILRTLPRGPVVIAANYDEPKQRPDGTEFYPGQEGARELADAIYRPMKIIYPKRGKDWRAFGASREVMDAIIQNAGWHTRRSGVTA
jgi:hypothetical protein